MKPAGQDRTREPLLPSPTDAIALLSVSAIANDHARLLEILGNATAEPLIALRWTFQTSESLESAADILERQVISIVICERDLGAKSWTDLLDRVFLVADPPLMIVSSRLADERLWSEALNRGCWDVIPKPFDPREVLRILGWASLHWLERHGIHSTKTTQRMGGFFGGQHVE